MLTNKAFVRSCVNCEMDTRLFRSFSFRENNPCACSLIADVMMLNDVKAYLVACFRWPIPCCQQHTDVFSLRSAR